MNEIERQEAKTRNLIEFLLLALKVNPEIMQSDAMSDLLLECSDALRRDFCSVD